MSEGRLMIAYPLEMAGVIVSGSEGNFTEIRTDSEAELISAFYLVGAESLDAAVSFAKSDPRFDDSLWNVEDSLWNVEVRPILKAD